MEQKAYSEKLKDPRWQKRRLEILERDKWTCRACGEKEKTLHVHHIFYLPKTEPWDVPPGFLITFCEDCHKDGPCIEQYRTCSECPEYGRGNLDCHGPSDHCGEIIGIIGSVLNFILSNQGYFGEDYNEAIGKARFILNRNESWKP